MPRCVGCKSNRWTERLDWFMPRTENGYLKADESSAIENTWSTNSPMQIPVELMIISPDSKPSSIPGDKNPENAPLVITQKNQSAV